MHWHCGRYAKAHSFGHTAGEIAMDGNGTALLAGVAGALVGVNKDVWYWCAACSVSKCHRHSFVEPNRKTESPYFHCRLWSKAFGSKSSMEMNFIFHFTNIVSGHKKIAATFKFWMSILSEFHELIVTNLLHPPASKSDGLKSYFKCQSFNKDMPWVFVAPIYKQNRIVSMLMKWPLLWFTVSCYRRVW